MNGQEDNMIMIIRMEKLLAGISSKIRESTGEDGTQNSSLVKKIIDSIELFRKSVVAEMKKTPDATRMNTIKMRDCHTKIAETLLELETLQNISEEQNSNSEMFLKDITTCVNNEEKLMESIKEMSEANISKEIENSTSKMVNVKEQEEARQKLLQSEIDLAEWRLHNVVEFNAATEKILFDKCSEVEQEYTDLLSKYDRDIGACHSLLEKLSRENELVKAEKKDMEEKLAVQRELYNRLKKEREITLMKAFTKKLEFFRRNRAAKVIQRAWRAYFERISLKKRRKTRKK
ncbi:dynein regulatory complex protein 10 [Harpegnathos saltator]|uniref:dynein regulatory complex protein 10 n=1 Tax=Harpegnathos saltator TaxID=610380 RepID=UPI00058AC9C1|nr:dynein regulatory complex protein 10 [Harpegnathos saltator]